jgi:hypothetical protein
MIVLKKNGEDYVGVRSISIVKDATSSDGYILMHFDGEKDSIAFPVNELEEIFREEGE